jgi:Family of unknown function (DUF6086)
VGRLTYAFKIGDEVIWSPSAQAAELFLGGIGATARVLELPSGITDLGGGDWFDIDRVTFPALVEAMLRAFTASSHWQYRLMLGSTLAVSLSVLYQADIEVQAHNEQERKALAQLRDAAF